MAISTITLDTYKQQINSGDAFNIQDSIKTAYDMNKSFNGRVGDEQVPLVVQYKEHGIAQQFKDGLVPFLVGFVGSLDDHDRVTAETGEAVSYVGTSADIVGLGRVKMNLPGTMFPREGFFYGFLGLQNADGKRITTFNVWFHVYNGNPDMFVNAAPFRTELQKLLDESEQMIDKADGEFKTKLQGWQDDVNKLISDSNTSLTQVQGTIVNIQSDLKLIKDEIAAGDVVTHSDLDKTLKAERDTTDAGVASAQVAMPLNATTYGVDTTGLGLNDIPMFKAWGYYNAAGIPQTGDGFFGVPKKFDLSLSVDLTDNDAIMIPKFWMAQIKEYLPDFDVNKIEVSKASDGKWIYLISAPATIGILCLNAKFK